MIQQGEFQELAERIVEDKRALEIISVNLRLINEGVKDPRRPPPFLDEPHYLRPTCTKKKSDQEIIMTRSHIFILFLHQ